MEIEQVVGRKRRTDPRLRQLGREALFIYDRSPGGMGYARGAMTASPRS